VRAAPADPAPFGLAGDRSPTSFEARVAPRLTVHPRREQERETHSRAGAINTEGAPNGRRHRH
jgi:hypothetical protein